MKDPLNHLYHLRKLYLKYFKQEFSFITDFRVILLINIF